MFYTLNVACKNYINLTEPRSYQKINEHRNIESQNLREPAIPATSFPLR